MSLARIFFTGGPMHGAAHDVDEIHSLVKIELEEGDGARGIAYYKPISSQEHILDGEDLDDDVESAEPIYTLEYLYIGGYIEQ